MKKNIISLAVAASLSLAAFSAVAEDMYRGAWYLVPGVSYMNTDNDLDANNGGGVFLKLGKELSESWDIQGGIGYNRAGEDTGIAGAGGRYKQTTLGVDALYMFSRSNFRPFLLAGLGAARNNVDYSGIPTLENRSRNSWMANVGLGAQYLFSDSFGLQADLRHQWSKSSAKAPGTSFDADGTIGNTLLSLGGIFRFGAPTPVAMAAPEPAPVAAPEPAPVAVAAPAPAPAPVEMAPICKPTMETVDISAEKLFGFDKSKLKDLGKGILAGVIEKMKSNPDIEVVMVTGYTDRLGSDKYNQKLSERRANQVKEYLVAGGVDASRLHAVGKGEADPVQACTGVKGKKLIECLAPNRRVIISAEKVRESGCK
ncbi:MAG: OmpA family protein [Methylophilaceae bacterium]|nr:OmpA family protein [Methylophilaceae bacterium]